MSDYPRNRINRMIISYKKTFQSVKTIILFVIIIEFFLNCKELLKESMRQL